MPTTTNAPAATLRLPAHGALSGVELSGSEVAALDRLESVSIRPSRAAPGSLWDVYAKHYVGVVRLGERQLVIEPKGGIRNFLDLLSFSSRTGGWRDDHVELAEDEGLLEAIAWAFATLAWRCLRGGVLQGYTRTEDALPVVRGRMAFDRQLARHPASWVPVEVTFDEYSRDIDENRILVHTAVALRRMGVRQRTDGVLHRIERELRMVGPVERWDVATNLNRLNARYGPSLRLADLIRRAASLSDSQAGVSAAGFLFDMNVIFEDFVDTALTDWVTERGLGSVAAQTRSNFDVDGLVVLRPDFVWTAPDGSVVQVVDAKYKLYDGHPSNQDLYQIAAYCDRWGTRSGMLVSTAAEQHSARAFLTTAGTTIHDVRLDLSGPVAEVRRAFGAALESLWLRTST